MSKPIIGHIKCPMCGNPKATVHQNAGRNSKALYFRCYPDDADQCGTIQPSLAGGQAFIKANMRPLNDAEKHIEADAAAENARAEQLKAAGKVKAEPKADDPAPKPKKSLFAAMMEDSEA